MNRQQLFDVLTQQFSIDELKTLCFQLDVNPESLDLSNRENFARSLVEWFERRGELWRLVGAVEGESSAEKFWLIVMAEVVFILLILSAILGQLM
ncbi:MAG: hypothetical protein AAGJ35_05905, partial [Myxococcota bacterium]